MYYKKIDRGHSLTDSHDSLLNRGVGPALVF